MKIPNTFRLSLREMFLLVALIATGIGWYVDRQAIRDAREFMSVLDDQASYDSAVRDFSYHNREFSIFENGVNRQHDE